ncbi:MAG: sigma-70 family RNA polymerase sigma factor [Caldilineaceae bacterium]|nr:sigma-70 family RNA polymerase sigma factor [Caldilineaceae bacterium]
MFTEIIRPQTASTRPAHQAEISERDGRSQAAPTTAPSTLGTPVPVPAAQEEATLVEQAKEEPAAFGILYERYVDRVYAYIYHRVGNAQDAEDLTARTFYRALDKLHTYEDRGLPFSAWLFRIAHNLVANWHRDRGRRRFLSLDKLWSHSKEGDTPEEQVEQKENQAALWEAIERLPEDRRNLLLYKFGSRLSNLEIGELLQKSESAIKSLYFRTLATLRKELETTGWGAPDGEQAKQEEEI